MNTYILSIAPLLLFTMLLVLTYRKVKNTLTVMEQFVNPVSEFPKFIESNNHCFIFFFDEVTCVKTIQKIKKIHNLLKDTKVPFIFINVVEGADPLSGTCPVCPYLTKYGITTLPALLYMQSGDLVKSLVKEPDHLQINEISSFIELITVQQGLVS